MQPANAEQAALLAEMLADAANESDSSRARRNARSRGVSGRGARALRLNRLDA